MPELIAGNLSELYARGLVMDIQVGDILKLKKQHPCGSREWEVLRVGADFRLKCVGCGHQIMIARRQVEKNVKNVTSVSKPVKGAD